MAYKVGVVLLNLKEFQYALKKLTNSNQDSIKTSQDDSSTKVDEKNNQSVKKGPLSFISGSLTSVFFGWLCLQLSKKVVIYFTLHSPTYTSQIAQSISSAIKTLAIGMCFLATFTFSFIGLGLLISFFRSLFSAANDKND